MARLCLSGRIAQKARLFGASINLVPCRMNSKVGCSQSESTCNSPKRPCGSPEMQLVKKEMKSSGKKGKPPFVSMWEKVPCDKEKGICPVNQRFDDLYYVESDKANRCYCQTWSSCPELEIKPMPICQNIEDETPPMQRRPPPKKKPSVVKCPVDGSCPQIPRKCFRKSPSRTPGVCPTYYRLPIDCEKPLAPYPSFSECKRLKAGELPLSECRCLTKPLMCEIWAEFRKRYVKK